MVVALGSRRYGTTKGGCLEIDGDGLAQRSPEVVPLAGGCEGSDCDLVLPVAFSRAGVACFRCSVVCECCHVQALGEETLPPQGMKQRGEKETWILFSFSDIFVLFSWMAARDQATKVKQLALVYLCCTLFQAHALAYTSFFFCGWDTSRIGKWQRAERVTLGRLTPRIRVSGAAAAYAVV